MEVNNKRLIDPPDIGWITNITIKNRRHLIELDNEYFGFIYSTDYKKSYCKEIQIGNQLTSAELAALEKHLVSRGKKYLAYLLAKQDYSQQQLTDKLLAKDYSSAHTALILDFFVEHNIVDDQNFIRRYVELYKNSKSRQEIKYKLLAKKLDAGRVEQELDQIYQTEPELEQAAAYQAACKKFKRRSTVGFASAMTESEVESEPEQERKIITFLARKGFSFEICRAVCQAMKQQDQNF